MVLHSGYAQELSSISRIIRCPAMINFTAISFQGTKGEQGNLGSKGEAGDLVRNDLL